MNQRIVTGALFIRPRLSKAGNRTVNQAWIEVSNRLIVQTIFSQAADFVILNQYIRATDEFNQLQTLAGDGEIHTDTGFIAVATKIISGIHRAILTIHKWRSPTTGVVAVGMFDFDHMSAHVA